MLDEMSAEEFFKWVRNALAEMLPQYGRFTSGPPRCDTLLGGLRDSLLGNNTASIQQLTLSLYLADMT
jgi:hypothetical protein